MYVFSAPVESGNKIFDAIIVFSGQVEGDEYDYGFAIESAFRRYPVGPDIILFIYPGYLQSMINEFASPSRRIYENLNRYREKPPILYCSFHGSGRLRIEPINGEVDSEFVIDDSVQRQIVQLGIFNLAKNRRDAVILDAPPGTVFVKPSGSKFNEFIKASDLSVGYSENLFLGFCLLYFQPDIREIRAIYIDTSGISAYVEALIYYLHKFSESDCRTAKYYSFGSYDRKRESRPDDTSSAWVIISASASNNLGQEICREWSLNHDQVITLLSYTPSQVGRKGDRILSNISELSRSRPRVDKFGSEISVKVVGENFTAQISESNPVLLKSTHKPPSVKKSVEPFLDSDVFSCNRRKTATSSPKQVYLDFDNYCSADSKLSSWLKKIVSWYAPANLKWVIYDKNDDAAKKLFSIVQPCLPSNAQWSEIGFSEAEVSVSGCEGAIILAPVISSGRSLLQLSRNMRMSNHDGMRIFIVPYVLSSMESQFIRMKNTLLYGPDNMKYLFFNRHQVFVGDDSSENSWSQELRVVENLESAFWQWRQSILSRLNVGLAGAIGTPAAPSRNQLGFTQHFAFWADGYDAKKANAEAVFVTVCAVLQMLREKPYTEFDSDSLLTRVYQHSVIDPENFARLNDPLLQSCIWRAAKAHELDYSGSTSLCLAFENVIFRLIREFAKGKENAALDLLVGIACKKIQVSSEALDRILNYARSQLGTNVDVIELVGYIYKHLVAK